MSVRDRIIELLRRSPSGLDDDEIARSLGLAQRQQANARCRQLADERLISRLQVDGKIRNCWTGHGTSSTAAATPNFKAPAAVTKPWYWEGNVVSAVVTQLQSDAWTINATANTATRQKGADIMAVREGDVLVVEVKGYPSAVYEGGERAGQPKPTNPATQARHWLRRRSIHGHGAAVAAARRQGGGGAPRLQRVSETAVESGQAAATPWTGRLASTGRRRSGAARALGASDARAESSR